MQSISRDMFVWVTCPKIFNFLCLWHPTAEKKNQQTGESIWIVSMPLNSIFDPSSLQQRPQRHRCNFNGQIVVLLEHGPSKYQPQVSI